MSDVVAELTTAEREAKSAELKRQNAEAKAKAKAKAEAEAAAKAKAEAPKTAPKTAPKAEAPKAEAAAKRVPPKPAKCDNLPEGAKFRHVTTWRKMGFYLVKGAKGETGTALLVPGKTKPLFWLDKKSDAGGEGRRQANLFARHAVGFWTGWTGSETSVNSPACEGSPWTGEPTPYKKSK